MESPTKYPEQLPPASSSRQQMLWVWLALAGFVVVVFWPFFMWQMTYYIPAFWLFTIPVALGLLGIALLSPLIALIPVVLGWRRSRLLAFLPLLISLSCILAGLYLDTTTWWLNFNHWYYYAASG